uniref:Cation efflux protein cytoplasmic domain-containing protein n=1 Tax=Sinocyclocheilus anshuiensis TaxID=1608454 RepID=A0A671K5U1_9TELE
MARISGSTRICTLVLTLCFLVFEIVVGQICRSLLTAVDSFHTLYIFINLALSALKRMRLKPFGIMISALLMASQCVSISLEILTHVVQPEPILHPLLSIVVGGASLIFNMLVLAWKRSSRGIDEAADGIRKSLTQQLGSIGVIQHLLGSVLVLTNGLVLLLSAAHCHRPHSDCHLLVYLDAGFSAVCVLVLLCTALPKLRRYGLLVLQATPLHLSVAQVRLRLTEVPGVLSVHELHVWQLSDALMVASLHVHCPDGLNAAQCTDLMGRTKAVLAAFGINHCTVQPEFIRSDAAAGGGSGRSLCSLRCGQECVEKLCCSPQVDKTSCPKTESPACVKFLEKEKKRVSNKTIMLLRNVYEFISQ